MANFIFWNTQRLGSGTPTEKGIVLEAVLAQIFHSLGYAGILAPDYGTAALERFTVPRFKDLFATDPHKKGGNDFTKQSKRMVVRAGGIGGVLIYLYHAI